MLLSAWFGRPSGIRVTTETWQFKVKVDVCIHSGILAIKKNEWMPFVVTWIDLEIIIPSELSQIDKDKYHLISRMGMHAKSLQSCPTLCDPVDCSHQTPLSMEFPGKNTGVGCHFLLQGIFLTQRSNPGLLHWQANSLPLSHQGSP